MRIELQVNGRRHALDVDPSRPLLGVLREELALTGSKYGCGEGQCGACTVLLDGKPVHSCVTPVSSAASVPITTIEGLEHDGQLHPLQQAFIEEGALQCGYCTPGMIMTGAALLAAHPSPTPEAIAGALQGNLCRCGTYPRIIAAVQRAASAGRSGSTPTQRGE